MHKMLAVFGCIFFLLSCGDDKKGEPENSAYTEQKASLASQEKKTPLSFLKVTAVDKKNLLGNTVVKGEISNSATVCSYKEIRLKLLSFTKEGKMLEEHEDVLPGTLKPNTGKDFKLRYRLPKNADSISVAVMNAVVAE